MCALQEMFGTSHWRLRTRRLMVAGGLCPGLDPCVPVVCSHDEEPIIGRVAPVLFA